MGLSVARDVVDLGGYEFMGLGLDISTTVAGQAECCLVGGICVPGMFLDISPKLLMIMILE